MKKLKTIVTVLLCTIFFTTQAGILADDDSEPEGPTIINKKGPFRQVGRLCKTKARKIAVSVDGSGGKGETSSTQVNYKYDCGSGKDLSCQITDCDGKTLIILIHEGN